MAEIRKNSLPPRGTLLRAWRCSIYPFGDASATNNTAYTLTNKLGNSVTTYGNAPLSTAAILVLGAVGLMGLFVFGSSDVQPPVVGAEAAGEQAAATTHLLQNVDVTLLTAQELRGRTVRDDRELWQGSIRDVNGPPGPDRKAVVSVGGIMGLGSREVSVPLQAMSLEPDGTLTLRTPPQEIQNRLAY